MALHDKAITNVFVQIAKDCPVFSAEAPKPNTLKKQKHVIEYELLIKEPYYYTHASLIYEVYIRQQNLSIKTAAEKKEIWTELFSKGHPCLRASALTKRYGFGAHYNEEGKIALYPTGCPEYKKLCDNYTLKQKYGMATKKHP